MASMMKLELCPYNLLRGRPYFFKFTDGEETPGGGWDRGVGGHGGRLEEESWQAGEIGEVREIVDVMQCVGELDDGRRRGQINGKEGPDSLLEEYTSFPS